MAIAFGLMVLIVMDSILSAIDKQSFEKIINYETGHIKIFAKGYQKDKEDYPLDKNIDKPLSLIDKLKQDPEVAGITSRVNFRIMLSDGIDQLPAIGVALSPGDDPNVFKLQSAVTQGSFLAGTEEAMLIGKDLAEKFGVGVGGTLTILTRTKYDTVQALDLRIKGILRTEDPNIDYVSVIIPLDLGQKSLDLGSGVTEIDIKLKDPEKIKEFRDKLAREITGVEVATWSDLAEDVVAVSDTKRRMSLLLFSSVVIIALIGISNTILLAAFERVKEIGMMAAMGMKRRQIIELFVLEGAAIGFMGSVTGCVLGILLNWPLVKYGLDFTFIMKDIGLFGYRTTGVMYGMWRPGLILFTLVFGVVISALVSIYPAWVASKMEPTEALRKG
jgi:ABC-type lipoprotein release transport system permease subunit